MLGRKKGKRNGGPRWLAVNQGPNRLQRRAEAADQRRGKRREERLIDAELNLVRSPGASTRSRHLVRIRRIRQQRAANARKGKGAA